MEIGNFGVVSKLFVEKLFARNEVFRVMQGNGLSGFENGLFFLSGLNFKGGMEIRSFGVVSKIFVMKRFYLEWSPSTKLRTGFFCEKQRNGLSGL